MALKVPNSNIVIRLDDSGGTLRTITSQVTEIDGLQRAWDMEDVTTFGDSETRQLKAFPQGVDITLRGLYHGGSSDVNAYMEGLAAQKGTSGIHTLEVLPDGTRLWTMEGSISRYQVVEIRKQVGRWEAIFSTDGPITITSSS